MAKIEIHHVSVAYPIFHARQKTFMEAAKSAVIGGHVSTDGSLTVNALEDITLQLAEGDRLGLLGANGAGKTTLLKAIAGILPPIKGEIRVEGRISPLTSIMLGLDNQATGYENIRIRGRLMGASDREISDAIPEIAEFTELGEYLDLPIKTYSSGMRMRLSFATSTAFQPEVLLLDEWLGTGDLVFRDKAARRLRQRIKDSGIFVFASHSRELHRRLSNKGAVLDRGRLAYFGPIESAFEVQDQISMRAEEDKVGSREAPPSDRLHQD
jgi:ABC-type polysaccharide/polyol phosphate transport system ATPase subunit